MRVTFGMVRVFPPAQRNDSNDLRPPLMAPTNGPMATEKPAGCVAAGSEACSGAPSARWGRIVQRSLTSGPGEGCTGLHNVLT